MRNRSLLLSSRVLVFWWRSENISKRTEWLCGQPANRLIRRHLQQQQHCGREQGNYLLEDYVNCPNYLIRLTSVGLYMQMSATARELAASCLRC